MSITGTCTQAQMKLNITLLVCLQLCVCLELTQRQLKADITYADASSPVRRHRRQQATPSALSVRSEHNALIPK